MKRTGWWQLSWLFNRRICAALLWTALVVCAALVVNLAGIHIVGSIEGWEGWLQAHAGIFLGWRLCLYAGTAWGWWWMRRRVLQREATLDTSRRFLRIEVAAVMAIVLMEGSAWLQHR